MFAIDANTEQTIEPTTTYGNLRGEIENFVYFTYVIRVFGLEIYVKTAMKFRLHTIANI